MKTDMDLKICLYSKCYKMIKILATKRQKNLKQHFHFAPLILKRWILNVKSSSQPDNSA